MDRSVDCGVRVWRNCGKCRQIKLVNPRTCQCDPCYYGNKEQIVKNELPDYSKEGK